ncbi:MAG: hypothetical protein QOJ37_2479, partial [Pseudonocardiales bacterium]|nr:hypothetical protein [Pseudonocardiales bacterium]
NYLEHVHLRATARLTTNRKLPLLSRALLASRILTVADALALSLSTPPVTITVLFEHGATFF